MADPQKPETFVAAVLALARWVEREAEDRYTGRAGNPRNCERDEREWLEVVRARERIEESRETERLIDHRQGDRLAFMQSAELLALAKHAVETVAARGDVDVGAWVARLAADVAKAGD